MAATWRPSLIVLAVLFAAALLPGALALNTHLNVTVLETVHQNVTFAENFNLVENRTYSLIEGVITVSNPGAETVYDINVRVENIDYLDSDFINVAGRSSYQVVFPNITPTSFAVPSQINSSWLDLGADLDEDGIDDRVRVNDTHLIFNLTSQYELYAEPFANATNSSLNISDTPTVLDMTYDLTALDDDNEYNDGVRFANVTVSGTVTTAGVLNTAEVTVTLYDEARPYAILHIPELRAGNSTVFNYNVSSILVDPPLDINSTYTNPEFETKVLAGEHFGVRLSASNIATVGALQNVNITLQAADVNVTNATSSEVFNFTLHNLSDANAADDFANVDNSSNRTWQWVVNGGTIPIGETQNISFQIRAPDTVATSGTHLALTQTLQYEIPTTASTLSITEVRGRGAVTFNTTKRIVSPQDNLSNNNVTWESNPKVGASENITYTLEKVSLWVTTTLDPNQETSLTRTYEAGGPWDINLTSSWTAGTPWLFNFTDGSSSSAPPPIVWVKPYWIIKNTGNQIVNSTITVNGTDLYMNYIYVVNGYWLEVQKQVLDAGDDAFDIRVEVRNRGNGYTPQNMTVTVYDFIPQAFTAYNFTPSYNNASNVTGEFSGVAYQWDVGLRTNLSTSFAPKGDANNLDYFWMNYSVNGSGDFQVSDLYIVGLDPRLVDGASAYEGVSVLAGIATTSREMLYLAVVVFLIGINVANFLMTSRINRKLDRK